MARKRNPLTDIVDNYTPESRALQRQLRMLCAGHPVNRSLGAALDLMAEMIGLMATEMQAAEAICDAVGPDLKAAIRENWDELCRVRALASQAGSA